MKRCHIVKREGHRERYDEKKVYASVYAAALDCDYSDKKAERIAQRAMKLVNTWMRGQSVVDSQMLRHQVIKHISDRPCAMMYRYHQRMV